MDWAAEVHAAGNYLEESSDSWREKPQECVGQREAGRQDALVQWSEATRAGVRAGVLPLYAPRGSFITHPLPCLCSFPSCQDV